MIAIASQPAAVKAVADTFEARCRSLGLFAWNFDAQPSPGIQSSPDLNGDLQSLFASQSFLHLIKAAAGVMLQAAAPGPQVLAPGIWAIPISIRKRRRVTGLCLVVGIEPLFINSKLFLEMCAESGVATLAAQAALDPLLQRTSAGPEPFADMLNWMHQDMAAALATRSTMNEFSTNLSQSYEQVNFVFRLGRYLNVVEEPLQLIDLLLCQIREIMPFAWVALRFLPHRTLIPEIAGAPLFHGSSPHREAIGEAALAMLNECTSDEWTKILTPAQHPLAATCETEILAEPILHNQRVIGVLMVGNKGGDDPDLASTDMQLLDAIANFFGVFHENIARFAEQRDLFLGSLHALTSAIDAKDRYTRGHSERVGLLAAQMARSLGMSEKIVEQYRIAGLVHDVGKIGVPEAVLKKAAALTDEEFAEIKKHPAIGYEMLKGIAPLEAILPGVLHHHERWDGNGYPANIAGNNIPLIARVLALADTFDAMSSNRAYRTSRTREVVIAEIRRNAGKQFDPDLVEQFVSLDFSQFDANLSRFST